MKKNLVFNYSELSNDVSLRRHVRSVHEKIKNHQCIFCDKKFSSKQDVNFHIKRKHLNEKNHKCEKCDKSYVQPDKLWHHVQKVHEGIRNYKCDDCVKSFYVPSELKNHQQSVHQGIKKYKCHICNQKFSQSGHLKKHIMTVHQKLKNFKCDLCEEKFLEPKSRDYHIKKVHQIEPSAYKCDICNKNYYYKNESQLQSHIKKFHSNIPENQKDLEICLTSNNQTEDEEGDDGQIIIKTEKGKNQFNVVSIKSSYEFCDQFQKFIHSSSNVLKENYNCKFCSLTFSKEEFLERHVQCFHNGNQELYTVQPKISKTIEICQKMLNIENEN